VTSDATSKQCREPVAAPGTLQQLGLALHCPVTALPWHSVVNCAKRDNPGPGAGGAPAQRSMRNSPLVRICARTRTGQRGQMPAAGAAAAPGAGHHPRLAGNGCCQVQWHWLMRCLMLQVVGGVRCNAAPAQDIHACCCEFPSMKLCHL